MQVLSGIFLKNKLHIWWYMKYYYFVLRTATFLSFISPTHRVKKKIL
jgi:hypothetical protein